MYPFHLDVKTMCGLKWERKGNKARSKYKREGQAVEDRQRQMAWETTKDRLSTLFKHERGKSSHLEHKLFIELNLYPL